mmetsp:Transcript_12543/g.38852  ORF Transcript_12543/g.38852 Transcript_12543/m.38852 type:complete len:221 (-) Transcript_12543:192-854(-)
MVAVEGVAAAAVVVVLPRGRHDVVRALVQPAEGNGGAHLVALTRVVEHHVQDHLDAIAVALAHHLFELVQRHVRLAGVARHGRHERQRRVPPEVEPHGRRGGVVLRVHQVIPLHLVELVHRQQLQRRDAELLEVRQLGHHTGELAPRRLAHAAGLVLREAAHMRLVDHRVLHGVPRRGGTLPVELGGQRHRRASCRQHRRHLRPALALLQRGGHAERRPV